MSKSPPAHDGPVTYATFTANPTGRASAFAAVQEFIRKLTS